LQPSLRDLALHVPRLLLLLQLPQNLLQLQNFLQTCQLLLPSSPYCLDQTCLHPTEFEPQTLLLLNHQHLLLHQTSPQALLLLL
jgi:hypothetical protein